MSEPGTAELLNQVLQRLDQLEARLDRIQQTTDGIGAIQEKIPTFVEFAGTSATFVYNAAEERGIDPIQAGLRGAELAAEAAKPESMATLERLLAKQALLHRTLDIVDQLEADGTLDILIDKGAEVAPKLAKTIDVADHATTALIETQSAGFKPAGLFAQLGALMDGDVQKAIGFTLAIAKRFGQKLS
jgi:uncharacterized protein YjgD (DUF1641 family)